MKIPNRILATVAVAALAVTACADGGDETTAPTPGTETSAGTSTPADPAATDDAGTTTDGEATESAAVSIDDFAYNPASVTVAAGTEVTWTNEDPALHSVTAGTPEAPEPDVFDLDPIEDAGQTVSHTFEEPGTYDYFCRYHDFMLGTVEVTG
ncbi:MAG: cupredoxin domain-containing protein [Actinobacteria bacterium]|nr:cupredoxin domain-containing protein [Actinomycetota bacterium]